MPVRILASIACIGAISAITPAIYADPPHCPPGHAKKGECYDGKSVHRESNAYEQGYRDGQRDAEWRLGYPLPSHLRHEVIRDYDRYGLRRPSPGQYYARVDGQTLLIEAATQLVLEALTN